MRTEEKVQKEEKRFKVGKEKLRSDGTKCPLPRAGPVFVSTKWVT